jgi:hypothetical protein
LKRITQGRKDWSLRCYICDHNFETPESDYLNLEVPVESGEASKHRHVNRTWVGIDERTGKPICTECWEVITDTVNDYNYLDEYLESDIIGLREEDETDEEGPGRKGIG